MSINEERINTGGWLAAAVLTIWEELLALKKELPPLDIEGDESLIRQCIEVSEQMLPCPIGKTAALHPVFQYLTSYSNSGSQYTFAPVRLSAEPNYPAADPQPNDSAGRIVAEMLDKMPAVRADEESINAVLRHIEDYASYVSCSDSEDGADISLYDHIRLRTAAATCLYAYL